MKMNRVLFGALALVILLSVLLSDCFGQGRDPETDRLIGMRLELMMRESRSIGELSCCDRGMRDQMVIELEIAALDRQIQQQVEILRTGLNEEDAARERRMFEELLTQRSFVRRELADVRADVRQCRTQECAKERIIEIGSFSVSNSCGQTVTVNGARLQNESTTNVRLEQQRVDLAMNKVIGAQSWGCHVRPEPQVIVIQQPVAAPTPVPVPATPCYRYPCYRYGYRSPAYAPVAAPPPVYPYTPAYPAPVIAPQAVPIPGYPLGAVDTRNPVITLPPGVPSPGCTCPGHRPGEPCHCGPNCRQCQGACSNS